MLDERDLVDRMGRGEQRAFDQFVDAFAARRSSLDAAALFTWLCQICRNQLADARRAFRAEWQLLMRVPTFNSAR